ncbi:EXS-domain-containing protein [Suhomyces tanzawaensis NRRL Y-17324]|uniref:EXS-domain-containing protein n=1 Tax=Suhomyces tanzawaensis NRRL Y-17324 TaxID=984487 RepID=A0A1E4SDI0_9ASCO|nr:EXS-domain-containing protein [Suhomyces tanzawaensis NRRL Y-17324]ODV77528.1 EXS-domain-containing protein [Suhomyces tanzawaensis NRRL Y-17324]
MDSDGFLFKDVVPLPFKILFFLELGVFLWLFLIIICTKLTPINVVDLLKLSYTSHNYTQLDRTLPSSGEYAASIPSAVKENILLAKGVVRNFRITTVVNIVGFIVYKLLQYSQNDFVLKFSHTIIPAALIGFTLHRVFYKSSNTNYKGQYRIFTTAKRVLMGKINSSSMRVNDILLSDSLMSYSKVLNDFGLFVWKTYISEGPYNDYLEISILSIPILIRIKQCWFEYSTTKQRPHLLNLFKYASSFGPLGVNLCIKRFIKVDHEMDENLKQAALQRLQTLNNWWYLTSFINSTYSFIWDIKMDWGFGLFDQLFDTEKPFRAIRTKNQLHYPSEFIYYVAIVVDFMLRFIWVLKPFIVEHDLNNSQDLTYLHILSTFLFGYDSLSFGYTVIEFLELFRRWMWCFFKLESDFVKLGAASSIELEEIPKQS